jgi:WD40 repeat protein
MNAQKILKFFDKPCMHSAYINLNFHYNLKLFKQLTQKKNLNRKRKQDLTLKMNDEKNKTAESVFIAAGCNRSPKALDWGGAHNQLIYAQSRSVALMDTDTEPFQIKCSLNMHKEIVNSVKWISSNGFIDNTKFAKNEFVSTSKDKTVIVWRGSEDQVLFNNFFLFNLKQYLLIFSIHIKVRACSSTRRAQTKRERRGRDVLPRLEQLRQTQHVSSFGIH